MRQCSLQLVAASALLWFGSLSMSDVRADFDAIPYLGSGAINATPYTFTATETGLIGAYFYGSTAGYTNTLSLLVNGTITPESSIGVLNNQTSHAGDFVILGYAHAGDILTFQLNVLNTGDTWYSDKSLNVDGINHAYATSFPGYAAHDVPPGTYVGFEDLYGGGDRDYDDETFVFTNVSVSPIPEPETYAMLLTGLGLLAFTVRHRKTA